MTEPTPWQTKSPDAILNDIESLIDVILTHRPVEYTMDARTEARFWFYIMERWKKRLNNCITPAQFQKVHPHFIDAHSKYWHFKKMIDGCRAIVQANIDSAIEAGVIVNGAITAEHDGIYDVTAQLAGKIHDIDCNLTFTED